MHLGASNATKYHHGLCRSSLVLWSRSGRNSSSTPTAPTHQEYAQVLLRIPTGTHSLSEAVICFISQQHVSSRPCSMAPLRTGKAFFIPVFLYAKSNQIWTQTSHPRGRRHFEQANSLRASFSVCWLYINLIVSLWYHSCWHYGDIGKGLK